MADTITVRKLLDFDEIAPGLTLVNITVDFKGCPVLLFDEGRPPFPIGTDHAEVQRWYKTPPIAHVIVRYSDGVIEKVRIINESRAIPTRFAQPLRDGWLLADSRNGSGRVYDKSGEYLHTINIGDAINDLQTTPDGLIWVSYFDEGVFGGGVGANGLVCFDQTGAVQFRFTELAEKENLQPIYDCYALNVCEDRVWLSYYSAFPLVCLKNFELSELLEPAASFNAFAMRSRAIVYVPSYGGRSVFTFDFGSGIRKEFDLTDSNGALLKHFRNRNYSHFAHDAERLKYYKPFETAGRLGLLYIYNDVSLYAVPKID